MDPNEHFFPSIQIAFDKFASSKIAPEILAPSKFASYKLAPLKDAPNKLDPSKLTFAKLALSKLALLQLAPCKLEAYKFELLKFEKIKLPIDKLELFICDFSKLERDRFTPDISDLARPAPDKSRFSTKLQFVQSTSFVGWSSHAANAKGELNISIKNM